jgi:methylenetetrahydrofolate dehydrogenase (NADP+)/methenyltetrahydrofolate cyclohydrolase
VCHTKAVNLADECRKADVLVACAGAAKMITADYVRHSQIVVDVGINMLTESSAATWNMSPSHRSLRQSHTFGGVGTVTTSVLLKQVIASA